MKCVCGHSDYEIGSEQFKTLWMGKEEYFTSIEKRTPSGMYIFENKTIYACPKCGTLKIDV